ncbi:MAG: IS1380 family transposase [Candidatus Binatia bacterium]
MSRRKMQMDLIEAERHQRYEAATSKEAGPVAASRGVLPFVTRVDQENDTVTGRAGLPLVVEAFRAYRGDDLVKEHLRVKKRARGYDEVEMVEAFLLLMAAGGEHLEDFTVLGEDGGLCRLLDRRLPSPDAARAFLLRFHDEGLVEAARSRARQAGERSWVPEESAALAALGRVQAELVTGMADQEGERTVTLDHDATIIESSKQSATWHYKGGRGYQPVAVVWAEQNLVVADEFRDGNVPAGKDNLRLIKRAFQVVPEQVSERRFRADSACYEERVLKWLADPERDGGPRGEIGFTISADISRELRAVCETVQEEDAPGGDERPRWHLLDETRASEVVEWSEVEFTPGNWPKSAQPLRYLVVRFTKRQGALYADGQQHKHLAVVSNRMGAGDALIRWHWKKAGTIEHVHDETKNGLGAGVLPCAELGANAAWYRLAMLTYNVLTIVKRETLPPSEQHAKPKRVRFLVFDLAARLTHHARTLYAHLKAAAIARIDLVLARHRLHQRRRWKLRPAPA